MTASNGTPSGGRIKSVDREAAVKRLKKFYKVTAAESGDDLGKTVVNETDRGSVILLSTAVEDILLRRIKSEMVPLTSDEHGRLFGPDAPLGSFSAKIKLAYALDLIDRDVCRMCDLVREMRNACAHSARPLSFADDELVHVMSAAYSYVSDEFGPSGAYKEMDFLGRLHFIWLIGWLTHAIRTGSKDGATELINQLIADANEIARDALVQHRASKRKHRERSSPKNPSRRRD